MVAAHVRGVSLAGPGPGYARVAWRCQLAAGCWQSCPSLRGASPAVARAGRVGVAGQAGGDGGLRVGDDPEGRGRARAAHARCIVLTENAVCFESSGGGAERVPPAD